MPSPLSLAMLLPAALGGVLLPSIPGASWPIRALRDASSSTVAAPNDRVVPNDNTRPAGQLSSGVLTLRLVARRVSWQPDLEGDPVSVYAFAEEGKAPRIPGPMIRVRAGTEVRVSIRSELPKRMLVLGLQDRPASPLDSTWVEPAATREYTFKTSTPGTYYYSGRTEGKTGRFSLASDGQLVGALVVDPVAGPPGNDRVMVMTLWESRLDSTNVAALAQDEEVLAMNGLTWPHTERLQSTVGDSVHWRVINANNRSHPMHLHGFYYVVNSVGRQEADSVYSEPQRRLAVTERMIGGSTFSLTWVPTRAGNWLFHCHLIAHVSPRLRLAHFGQKHDGQMTDHAVQGMAGLVMGVLVKPRRGEPVMAKEPTARRKLRLFVNERARVYDSLPGYAYVLQDGPQEPARDSLLLPGSTITLTRGEPTEITVFNRSSKPATVHWHGIELESFYDGVGDWSGWGSRTAPPIAPNDSFLVRLTPDRAGTFIYHTHSEEGPQLSSGLYGPLIILEPGERKDSETDRIFMFGNRGPGTGARPLVNGLRDHPTIELRAGQTYRFRFINITANNTRVVRLVADSATTVPWTLFAKDGATLPDHQKVSRARPSVLGPGETYDYEFVAPRDGELTLEVSVNPTTSQRIKVVVRQ